MNGTASRRGPTPRPPDALHRPKRLILVGPPNVGKSVLFGILTGTYATVSNYPGTTVEVTEGTATVGAERVSVIDTPGVNSLTPNSEDERVTRDILLAAREDGVVIQVADAKNLPRALSLTLQLGEMGLPSCLCLNLADEALSRGIEIDRAALADRLGIPVVATVAPRRQGTDALPRAAMGACALQWAPRYSAAVEELIARAEAALGRGTARLAAASNDGAGGAAAPAAPASPGAAGSSSGVPIADRALAVMALSGDSSLLPWLCRRADSASLGRLEDLRREAERRLGAPFAYVVSEERMRAARELADQVTLRSGARMSSAADTLGSFMTRPVTGFLVLAVVLAGFYVLVGKFAAGTLVDLIENGLFARHIVPATIAAADRIAPFPHAHALVDGVAAPAYTVSGQGHSVARFFHDLVIGPYGLIPMGITYALAIVLPIVATFFFAFGILEDTGYLPRLATVTNRAFNRFGLNGKAVLPMVLGLGCDTMATLTARLMETRKERLLVILLLTLGIPCSAQLGVILGMLGGLPAAYALIWLAVVFFSLALTAWAAARLLPGSRSELVLELPPLRFPSLRNLFVKTMARIEWYLKEAVPLFLLGTLILFGLDRLRLLEGVRRAASPVVVHLLGLPTQAADAFIIGFLRRDFGAAGLFALMERGLLSPAQVVTSLVTITLFVPCIAQFLVTIKEQGARTAFLIAGFVFPFAILTGAVVNFAFRIAGVGQ